VVSLILMYSLAAQSIDQKASDAWLISRMVEKFHVQPRPLDKDMSAAIFDGCWTTSMDNALFLPRPISGSLAPGA